MPKPGDADYREVHAAADAKEQHVYRLVLDWLEGGAKEEDWPEEIDGVLGGLIREGWILGNQDVIQVEVSKSEDIPEEAARTAERIAEEGADALSRRRLRQVAGGYIQALKARLLKTTTAGGLTAQYQRAVSNYEAALRGQGMTEAAVAELVNQYEKRLKEAQARRTARTEVMRAVNTGVLAAWQEQAKSGEVIAETPRQAVRANRRLRSGRPVASVKKMWVTAEDERVCKVCGPLHGQTRRLRSKFGPMAGYGWMMVPPVHPNCRCTMELVTDVEVEKKMGEYVWERGELVWKHLPTEHNQLTHAPDFDAPDIDIFDDDDGPLDTEGEFDIFEKKNLEGRSDAMPAGVRERHSDLLDMEDDELRAEADRSFRRAMRGDNEAAARHNVAITELGNRRSPRELSVQSDLVDKVMEDGGFTYEPTDGSSPSSGFAVSPFKKREEVYSASRLDYNTLKDYVDRNSDLLQDENNHFGAWIDRGTGDVYLDVVMRYDNEETAKAVGQAANQLAIFNLGTMEEIDLRKSQHRAARRAALSLSGGGMPTDASLRSLLDRVQRLLAPSPEGDGVAKARTDVPGTDTPGPNRAEELREYWTTGPGGAKIGWGTDGDWTRCVAQLTEHLGPGAKGYCNLRHKEMTGKYPGEKVGKSVNFTGWEPSEEEAARVLKHLPGKHRQATHGNKVDAPGGRGVLASDPLEAGVPDLLDSLGLNPERQGRVLSALRRNDGKLPNAEEVPFLTPQERAQIEEKMRVSGRADGLDGDNTVARRARAINAAIEDFGNPDNKMQVRDLKPGDVIVGQDGEPGTVKDVEEGPNGLHNVHFTDGRMFQASPENGYEFRGIAATPDDDDGMPGPPGAGPMEQAAQDGVGRAEANAGVDAGDSLNKPARDLQVGDRVADQRNDDGYKVVRIERMGDEVRYHMDNGEVARADADDDIMLAGPREVRPGDPADTGDVIPGDRMVHPQHGGEVTVERVEEEGLGQRIYFEGEEHPLHVGEDFSPQRVGGGDEDRSARVLRSHEKGDVIHVADIREGDNIVNAAGTHVNEVRDVDDVGMGRKQVRYRNGDVEILNDDSEVIVGTEEAFPEHTGGQLGMGFGRPQGKGYTRDSFDIDDYSYEQKSLIQSQGGNRPPRLLDRGERIEGPSFTTSGRIEEMERALDSGIIEDSVYEVGSAQGVEMVKTRNGKTMMRRVNGGTPGGRGAMATEAASNEYLFSRVADALGFEDLTPATVAEQTPDGTVVYQEWAGDSPPDGMREDVMSFMDALTVNTDRHGGNRLRGPGGHIAIDNAIILGARGDEMGGMGYGNFDELLEEVRQGNPKKVPTRTPQEFVGYDTALERVRAMRDEFGTDEGRINEKLEYIERALEVYRDSPGL